MQHTQFCLSCNINYLNIFATGVELGDGVIFAIIATIVVVLLIAIVSLCFAIICIGYLLGNRHRYAGK